MAVVKECFDSSSQDWRDDDCVQVEAGVAVRYLRKYDDVYLVVGLMQPDDMGKVEGLCLHACADDIWWEQWRLEQSRRLRKSSYRGHRRNDDQYRADRSTKKTRFSKAGKGCSELWTKHAKRQLKPQIAPSGSQ